MSFLRLLTVVIALLCSVRASAFTPSPNNTVVTTVGPTITDSFGNTWAINSGAQIVVSGAVQTITSGVTELAYVNGVVWQNTSFGWYAEVSISSSCVVTWSPATTISPLPSTVAPASITPSRAADFLGLFSVQIALSTGGAPYTQNSSASMVSDIQYVGATHVRDAPGSTTSGSSFMVGVSALANAGISWDLTLPTPAAIAGTLTGSSFVTSVEAMQAGGASITSFEQLVNPATISPFMIYSSVDGAGTSGLTWVPVANLTNNVYTTLKATSTNGISSLPVFGVSRMGAEVNNAGLQWGLSVPTPLPSGVLVSAGTQFADDINLHPYPSLQNQIGSFTQACQPNDPFAGNAITNEVQANFVSTYLNAFAGPSAATADALPFAITAFGYQTSGTGTTNNVNEDKKGRCLMNGLFLGSTMGAKLINIMGLYDLSTTGYGLMASSGVPNTSGTYLHNLTAALADTGSAAHSFTPTSLSVGYTGLCGFCYTKVLQKSNGHYEIAIGSNQTNYNFTTNAPISVVPTSVTVNLPASGRILVYDPTNGTAPIQTTTGSNVTVSVADYPVIVDYVPGSGTQSANNTVVLAGSPLVITDNNFTVWGISSGNQVTYNGVVLTGTSNVVELAYVNTVVWQLNSSGNWYSFTSTGGLLSGPTTVSPLPSQNFSVSGGQILTPSGAVFNGRGIAIDDTDFPTAITNSAAAPLTSLFPGINFVRLAMDLNGASCSNSYNFNIDLPAQFQSQINWLTSLGIVVVVSNYAYPQTCSVQTGSQLTAEVGWYQAWATAFINNPLVWFATPNEPLWNNEVGSQAPVTAEEVAVYNGIRATGNNTIVVLSEVAGGPTYTLGTNCSSGACLTPASAYQTMTNVVWDLHLYANCCNGETTQVSTATILATLQGNVTLAQQFTSANGTVPVIVGEYGPAASSNTYAVSGNNVVAAVQESGLPTVAWNWDSGDCCDNVTNGSNGLTSPYGAAVAAYIAAGSGPVTSRPTVSAPAMLTATLNTTAAVAGVTATDVADPSDTISFVGTSTGNGTLSATGATGSGTGTITFSGSITALNTVLGTITFFDATTENPTLLFSIQDQHSLSASATTAVTVVGGVSPNCTIVTTVGPTITSAGPPPATWSINSNAQIVANGSVLTGTANVTELAYVNGLLWQANTAGNWYSSVAPVDGFSSATTTNPTTGCNAPTLSVSAPAGIAATFTTTTPIPSVSASDSGFPNDTMSLTVTASSPSAQLHATGATGNGTSTLTFSGSLTALNALLNTMSMVVPGPTIVFAGTSSSFVDCSGNTWSIAANSAVQESIGGAAPTPVPGGGDTLELTIVGCTIYGLSTSETWYYWSGSFWVSTTNPIGAQATAGVVAGTGNSFTDGSGNVWTISSGGEVLKNGAAPAFSANVAQIDLVSGVVWFVNTSNQWSSWSGTAWVAGSNPLGARQSVTVTFAVTDQHSGSGTAITTVSVTSALSSPNSIVTRSPGVVVADSGGEQFTIVVPPSAPAQAAAVGYNNLYLGPNVTVGATPNPTTSYPQFIGGANWVPYTFTGTSWTNIGFTQNSDGSVTLNGTGEAFGNGLATAAAGDASLTSNRLVFTGQTFSGGGYFEATMKGSTGGPMSFWMNDIETTNGVSVNAGPNPWPGQATGYGNWIERDCAEFDSSNLYGGALHNWYALVGSGDDITPYIGSDFTPSPTPDYTQYHKYGCLWVPANGSTPGYTATFFDGTEVGVRYYWTAYNSSLGPPPVSTGGTTGNPPGNTPSTPSNAGSVWDTLHMFLILGGAVNNGTVTIQSVNVWQASSANDLPANIPAITAQIAVNGVIDSTTSNVVELAYVNGNIWYETSSGNWYFKANAAATWAGPTKISPINKPNPVHRR